MPDEVEYKRKFTNTSMDMDSVDFDDITIVTSL